MSGAALQDDAAHWTTLAILLRPQGRKGEILADLSTDAEVFKEPLSVILAPPGFAGLPSAAKPAQVTSAWLPTGRNLGRIVLTFTGVDSITAAERLAGLAIFIPRAERPRLEDGAEYIEDLIGCRIFEGEHQIGTIDSVEFSHIPRGKTPPRGCSFADSGNRGR